MKVIDLLNMISKEEEVPKKVMSRGVEWELEEGNHYYYLNDCGNNKFVKEDLFKELYELHGIRFLNDEVEILEEEKKIPEKIGAIKYCEDPATALIHHKVDEIIDYLEQENKKLNNIIKELDKKSKAKKYGIERQIR